ncbi:MAG: hypothetical protein IJ348_03545 [Alistipes sp.]|nr:hypothetical protein [Alistipes sp.]
MKKFIITTLLLAATFTTRAQESSSVAQTSDVEIANSGTISAQKVGVKKKAPRIDREVDKRKFVFKGETMLGLTASYGTIDTEDTNLGLLLDDLNIGGNIVSIKPFIGYFYRDNNCVGVRFGYSHTKGDLNNAALNLGEQSGISFGISDIHYRDDTYAVGLFHRTYVPLDRKGRFSVFAEWELSGSIGNSEFNFAAGEAKDRNISKAYKANLSFSPGLAVYIFPNVCASISLGLGGLKYNHIRQVDGLGNFAGSRNFSKLQFRLNLADINIGVNIHLWGKKRAKESLEN